VVEHTGASLQQGHYRVYVQERARWFACNDAWVQFADPEEIERAQGYLLFYMRRGVPL
jgi:ubiquitin carboxyl-terminal hydrolase 22/27/51